MSKYEIRRRCAGYDHAHRFMDAPWIAYAKVESVMLTTIRKRNGLISGHVRLMGRIR